MVSLTSEMTAAKWKLSSMYDALKTLYQRDQTKWRVWICAACSAENEYDFALAPTIASKTDATASAINASSSPKIKYAFDDVNKNLTSADWNVRRQAIQQITDQKFLVKFALAERHIEVACAAVEQITEQQSLSLVARTHRHVIVRGCAVERLTDQPTLVAIAQDKREAPSVRKVALQRIRDSQLKDTLSSSVLKLGPDLDPLERDDLE